MVVETLAIKTTMDINGTHAALTKTERDLAGVEAAAKQTAGGVGSSSGKMERELKGVERQTEKTAHGFKRLGPALMANAQQVKSAGMMMSMAVTLPVAIWMGGAIKAASDLEESTSKVTVVFKESAAEIKTWAEGAAENMGMSENAALSAAGTFGNLFVAMGNSAEQSAEWSMNLTQLATDLASFNNTSVEEAVDALRAGMVGETEPLKKFGIAMNEASLKAEAMALGLNTAGATLDPLVKQQAAYSLIMKQSTVAQGDFARTSDGLANSWKIMSAQLKDATTSWGEVMVPAVKPIVSIIGDLAKVAGAVPAPLRTVGAVLALVAAAAGPTLWAVGSLGTGLKTLGEARKWVTTLREGRAAAAAAQAPMANFGGTVGHTNTRLNTMGGRMSRVGGMFKSGPASIAAYGASLLALGLIIDQTIKAFTSMRDAQKATEQARANAEKNEVAALDRIAKKYGEGSAQYQKMVEAIAESDRVLAESRKAELTGLAGWLDSWAKGMKEAWWISNPFKAIVGSFAQGTSQVAGALGFANGGEVNRPTLAMIGERNETEYVVPKSKVPGFVAQHSEGQRGGDINVTIGELHGTDERAARDFAKKVGRYVAADLSRRDLMAAATGF